MKGTDMGCDISQHVERRTGGKWEYVEVPVEHRPLRWYSLFSVLAGVRKDPADPSQRFWPQCAIPDDASERLIFEYAGGAECFAHSYRTLAELLAHDWSRWPWFADFIDWMKTLGEPGDVRFVFWFTN
jgi:hypothetical protein